MTGQIQMLKRRLESISRDLKVLWIAQEVFSMRLVGNSRWVSCENGTPFGRGLSVEATVGTAPPPPPRSCGVIFNVLDLFFISSSPL